MKAVKKPIEIEFERFTEFGTEPNVKALIQEFDLGGGSTVYKVFNKLHNSWIEIKLGDYVNVENPEDNYPVDSKYFDEHYTITQN